MGRLIKDNRLKPGGLSGKEVFEVQDIDMKFYLTSVSAMLGEVSLLTNGNGTTANGTAVDLGGILTGDTTIITDGNVYALSGLKTGATQVGAGAVVNELWVTASHASLPDGVIMIGI